MFFPKKKGMNESKSNALISMKSTPKTKTKETKNQDYSNCSWESAQRTIKPHSWEQSIMRSSEFRIQNIMKDGNMILCYDYYGLHKSLECHCEKFNNRNQPFSCSSKYFFYAMYDVTNYKTSFVSLSDEEQRFFGVDGTNMKCVNFSLSLPEPVRGLILEHRAYPIDNKVHAGENQSSFLLQGKLDITSKDQPQHKIFLQPKEIKISLFDSFDGKLFRIYSEFYIKRVHQYLPLP